jgi:hypothetical protein
MAAEVRGVASRAGRRAIDVWATSGSRTLASSANDPSNRVAFDYRPLPRTGDWKVRRELTQGDSYGKIALSQNFSLDGVMQLDRVMQSSGPTDLPFKYTGWLFEDFDRGPEGGRFNYEEEFGLLQTQNAEVLLLGRVTYRDMEALWPTAEDELADRLNELPKYVVSSTLTDPPGTQ